MVSSSVLGTPYALVKNCEIEQNKYDRAGNPGNSCSFIQHMLCVACAYFSLSTIPGLRDIRVNKMDSLGPQVKSSQKEETDIKQL